MPERTFDELEELWRETPASPRDRGTVELIVARSGNGAHDLPRRVELTVVGGMTGDRWVRDDDPDPEAAITLMNVHAAKIVAGDVQPLHMPGDNFLVDLDIGEAALPAGARLRIGGAELEIAVKPHLGCQKFRSRFGPAALRWVNLKHARPLRLRGVNCRVVRGGTVSLGDSIERIGG